MKEENDFDFEVFKVKIKETMRKLNYSQNDLALMAKVSSRNLGAFLTGKETPTGKERGISANGLLRVLIVLKINFFTFDEFIEKLNFEVKRRLHEKKTAN